MPTTTSEQPHSDESRTAQERAEREEMFSFHPDILRDSAPLPRRAEGSDYDPPHAAEQHP